MMNSDKMVEGKNANSKKYNFVCVNCECNAKKLYQEYNRSVIRIEHCEEILSETYQNDVDENASPFSEYHAAKSHCSINISSESLTPHEEGSHYHADSDTTVPELQESSYSISETEDIADEVAILALERISNDKEYTKDALFGVTSSVNALPKVAKKIQVEVCLESKQVIMMTGSWNVCLFQDYCGQVVDKYVEFDPVIIFLDALLLKKQALRHILLNSGIQSCWKFTLVLLICETFTKLLQKSHVPSSGLSMSKVNWQEPDHVIYSAMEWDLYKYFILSLIELGCFLFGMIVWLLLWKWFIRKDTDLPSASVLLQGLVLSSFGQVFMLPMMLWGLQEHSNVCRILCQIFTFSANVQTTRVLCPVWSFGVSLISVLFGHTLSQMTIQQLSQWLNFQDIT